MNYKLHFIFIVFLMVISGCATTSLTQHYLSGAEESINQKDWGIAYEYLEKLLPLQTIEDEKQIQVKDLFKKYPSLISEGLNKSFSSDLHDIEEDCNEQNINNILLRFEKFNKSRLADSKITNNVFNKIKTTINGCISEGKSNITLDSVYERKEFFTSESKWISFKNQIDQAKVYPRSINRNMLEYIQKGNFLTSKAYLKKELQNIPWIGNSTATETIKKLFPENYEKIYKETHEKNNIILNIKTDPSKPLLEMDIIDKLNKYIMITAYQDHTDTNYTVMINELAYKEQSIPEQTIQKYVSWYQMDLGAALFSYPENSTAIYDVTTGGYIIRCAYRVNLLENDKKIDSVIIRDTIKETYKMASNLRYRNVFGGIGVPLSYPNSYVASEFLNSSSEINIGGLQKKVIDKIIDKIAEFKQIKKAYLFGKK